MSKLYLIREKSTKFGGAEVYLSRLAKALSNNGIEHQIVNSVFPKILPSWLRIILFNFQVCLTKRGKFYFSLERIVCPDVYRAGDGVHKIFLSAEKKSKFNPLHPVYLFLERRCFNNAKRIIANSHMIKNEIVKVYGVERCKIDVVYNGIQSKEVDYVGSYQRLSKEFDFKYNIPIILYVGSGFKRKGVEEFLHIVSKMTTKCQALIIGKEKKISYYQQLARDLGIDDKVIFTGPRADVEDFYTISDVFLFPTHYEPFSNVVLEAMACGNAVFTTKQNGAHEVLPEECIMSNPQDFSIVERVDILLKDQEALCTVKNDNQLIASKLSIEANMLQTLDIIKKTQND